ncbi:MAG TPA: hypothetical protein VGO57_07260 [Verrucomicrobiae bacterium]
MLTAVRPICNAALVEQDATHQLITLSDGNGDLTLRLKYDGGCFLDQVKVQGRDVVAATGVYTGIRTGNEWFTSKAAPEVRVEADKRSVTVGGIQFGKAGRLIQETWKFTTLSNQIRWQITRKYPSVETVSEVAFPQWNFSNLSTWTGGMLDNGGVVWNKYLDQPNATYGAHFNAVTFWNAQSNDCLRITPNIPDGYFGAGQFTRQTNDALAFDYTVSHTSLIPKHGQSRFLGNRSDLWQPFPVQPAEITTEFTLQTFKYDAAYDRGEFVGLDGRNIRELLNTVARYGVIDSHLVGGNGWRSGYICLHEPFFAQIAATVDAADYVNNFSAALDFERDHAIATNGRVKSRWCYGGWDAMPGAYDQNGFYEAQWGYLMDSQPDYVMNVAEQFNNTGDLKWLAGHKDSCERALEFLTRREVGNSGLVAMMTDSHGQNRGSDWIDIIWAAYENAFVNAQLYAALNLWADAEQTLNDTNRAENYRAFAARLKTSFNRPIAEGGFWDPTNQWYVHWRDQDGSAHGNNLVTPVNFASIAYGLCDDSDRQKAILDRMEAEMKKENLFYWPLCFFPYQPGEGAGSNFPFPKYENGDIFLSWGELGVRAYAAYDPALALKYVKNTLARYVQDGLSFQRYLRQTQTGEGDDILAGNCLPIVGLYRDIYGVQPKPNRLYLDPHLTDDLNGTKLHYELRGQCYEIALDTHGSSVTASHVTVGAPTPFGLSAAPRVIQYFSGTNVDWALAVTVPTDRQLTLQIGSEFATAAVVREWTETILPKTGRVTHRLKQLLPDTAYQVLVDGQKAGAFHTDYAGELKFTLKLAATKVHRIELKRP